MMLPQKHNYCTFSLMMMILMMTMMCLCGAHACFPFFQELKPASKPGSRRGSFNPANKDDGGGDAEVFICIT